MSEEDDEVEDRDDRRRRLRRRDPDDDYGDDDRDRPRRKRDGDIEATEFLIPTGVSGCSIAACYFGLVSCVPIPIFGLLLALIALPCGIVALRRKKKKKSTYGSVTGDVRAVIGVIASSLTLLGHVVIFIFLATGSLR
jgi:hypothetical protein